MTNLKTMLQSREDFLQSQEDLQFNIRQSIEQFTTETGLLVDIIKISVKDASTASGRDFVVSNVDVTVKLY